MTIRELFFTNYDTIARMTLRRTSGSSQIVLLA